MKKILGGALLSISPIAFFTYGYMSNQLGLFIFATVASCIFTATIVYGLELVSRVK